MPDKTIGAILNHALPFLNSNVHREKSFQVYDRPDPQHDSSCQQQMMRIQTSLRVP